MKMVKIYLFLLLLLFALNIEVNAQSQNHYLIKSAGVNFVYSGDFTGTEQLLFDNYGANELLVKKLRTAKGGEIVNTKFVRTKDTMVEINLRNNKRKITPLSSGKTANETLNMLNAGNFKKSGLETIAGYTCQKYTGEMGIICIWKGIVLKSEITVADKKMIKTAVLVDTVSDLKPSLFTINEN